MTDLIRPGKMGGDNVVSAGIEPCFQHLPGFNVAFVIIGMPLERVHEFHTVLVAVHVAHHVAAHHADGVSLVLGSQQPRVSTSRVTHVEIFQPVNRCVWHPCHHLSNTGR